MERRAKIVATLGPASGQETMVGRLLEVGVDVVRLNLSHGSHDDHRKLVERVRRVAGEQERHVPVILDLMGPRYRLGRLPEGGRELETGQRVVLGEEASGVDLPIEDPELLGRLRRGERVLVDNGLVELRVEDRHGRTATAQVVSGGRALTRKGINLPDTHLPFVISAKDRADIELALAVGADFLGASYVGRAADIAAIRRAVRQAGGELPLVAKLERGRAIEHLEEILAASDAVMVARGDLGVEVPLHTVPVLQKRIIDAGRRFGKPVVVATQMLESMMEHPRPTRAESSDVANAVFDGADALMLSGETAAGQYPAESVSTMSRIIQEAETYHDSRRVPRDDEAAASAEDPFKLLGAVGEPVAPDPEGAPFEVANAVAGAAVFTARHLGVRRIVAFSQGGFTARMIARYRPPTPILVFTAEPRVARCAQLLWGVRPLLLSEPVSHHHEVVQVVERRLLTANLAEPGERIIILMGDPIPDRPLTNLMRVHRVRET